MKKWLSLMLILGFGLTGCSEEKQETEILWWGVFENSMVFEEMIQEFEDLTPGVKVVFRKLTEDEYWEKLQENVEIGKVDVFMLPWEKVREWVPDLAASSNLTKEELENEWVKAGAETCLWNGQVICVPTDCATLALIWNPNLVTAKSTWEEVLKEGKRLSEASRGILGGVAWGAFDNLTKGERILALMMMQKGVDWFDQNGDMLWDESKGTNEKGFERFPGKEVKEFWNENETWDEERGYFADEFAKGKVGMVLGEPWLWGRILQADPEFEMRVSEIPYWGEKPENNFSLAGGWVLGVSRASEKQAEAWDLVRWVTGTKNAARHAEETQTVPARIDLLEKMKKEEGEFQVWIEQAEDAQRLPESIDWEGVWEKLKKWVTSKN